MLAQENVVALDISVDSMTAVYVLKTLQRLLCRGKIVQLKILDEGVFFLYLLANPSNVFFVDL